MASPTNTAPQLPDKLLASVGVRLRLAAASVAILAAGSAVAPREAAAPSRTEERANPLIEEQVAVETRWPSRSPACVTRAPVAHARRRGPAGSSVRTRRRRGRRRHAAAARLAGAGVVVSDGHVLTHALALDGRLAARILTAVGRADDAVLAAYDPATGIVLLRTAPGRAPPAVMASASPGAGALGVAVGHTGGRPVAMPAFVASADARRDRHRDRAGRCAGLPVFTLEGALVGILGAPGNGEVTLATRVVDRLIARAADGDVPRSVCLTVQRLDGALTRAFGSRGVLVASVVPDGPAATAGIVSGDVLVGVDGRTITSLEEARERWRPPRRRRPPRCGSCAGAGRPPSPCRRSRATPSPICHAAVTPTTRRGRLAWCCRPRCSQH
jgi:serine protease Do